MKKISSLLCMMALGMSLSTPSLAADRVLHFPFAEAVQRGYEQGVLDKSIQFHLAGSGSNSGKTVVADVVSIKRTNAFGKSDQNACERALHSALIDFQNQAKAQNAKTVRNLVSYMKKNTYSNPAQFQCHVGNIMAAVTLKGDIAR